MQHWLFLKTAVAVQRPRAADRFASLPGGQFEDLKRSLAILSDCERRLLANTVERGLAQERRLKAANSRCYDLTRHLSLYLTTRALEAIEDNEKPRH